MSNYIDNTKVINAARPGPGPRIGITRSDGFPAVATVGPLVSPNLYTPPGAALTVCDTVPDLTTYSVTLNSVTGTLAGEINEAYVYIKDTC